MVWCGVVWCSVSHYPTPDTPCADDQLTPNDEDPVAAVTTGSLFGEKDEQMIELKILTSEPHEVCVWGACVASSMTACFKQLLHVITVLFCFCPAHKLL